MAVERDIVPASSLFIYFGSYKDQSEHMQMRDFEITLLENASTCAASMRENTFEG